MNKEQAIKIVRETFEAPFDKVRFANFIKGLLNEPDLTDSFGPRTGNYIPDAFKSYVEKYERLGKYTDSEEKRLDILIVYLKRETSIERARSMQRNFIAGYLKGNYGSNNEKDAALVAFVSPNPEDWRFSLVKLDLRLEVDEKGKAKGIEEFTPAKRWSFLVGANEKSHTAQTQFQPILKDDENNPTLEGLEAAFNIEKVTDEFFKEYRRLFIETKEALDKAVKANPATRSDFEAKNINTVDLSKKLLGQIIFLYYLQKKGWFGVARDGEWGGGSKNFLRELFIKCNAEKKNFFNDVLEPLFYEALRLDRSHEDHYYKLFDCKIPFLNGGLFDPMNNYDWVKTEILLTNKLFSNQTKDNPEGDGILDVFDLYNFTVKEDEPFEKEVAIDPELLGKAYEKFNAIRPDNYDEFLKALKSGKKGEESKFNKQYGVYYTPREIVHYMCQQSLINYLYSELNPNTVYQNIGDDQLDLFGNAAKSGQLDLSVEHPTTEISKEDIATLILRGEQIKENDERVIAAGKETDTYSFLMPDSIRQNASLIDLKLASVKVCDPAVGSGAFPVGMMSEIVKARNVLRIYQTSEVLKTSEVLSTYHFKRQCIENSLYGVDIDAGAVEIAKLRLWLSLIVDEDDIQNIKPLPNLDYKIVRGNSLLGFPENWGSPSEQEIEKLIHKHFNETNPNKKEQFKKQIDEKIEARYKQSIKAFGYQVDFDFRTVFSEVFQANNGFDVVIGNPPYEEISEKGLRDTLKKKYSDVLSGHYDLYIFFFRQAFYITRRGGIVTYITPHTYLQYPQFQKLRTWIFQKTHIVEVTSRIENLFESAVVDNSIILLQNMPGNKNAITVFSDKVISSGILIDKKINQLQKGKYSDKAFDLETIQNTSKLEQFIVNTEKLGDVLDSSQGITVYAKVQGEKIDYFRDSKEDKTCMPVTKGREINKYTLEWSKTYIKYGNWLWCPRPARFFESPKILLRQTSDTLIGVFIEEPFYCIDSVHSIINKPSRLDISLKYVLALLNSKLGAYFYTLLIQEKNKVFAQVKLTFLRQFPIKSASLEEQKPIIKLVDRILAAKAKNPQADTSKLESEIDALVYQLYGLTEDEIKIVEGKE